MENDISTSFLSTDDIRRRADAIIASMADAVSIQDRNLRVLYQNQSHKDLIGEHIGEYCYRAYERRETACDGCPVNQAFADGGHHTVERHVIRDGRQLHVEISATPLKDPAGRIIAGIEVVRDISGRWGAEQALREEKNFASKLLDTVDALVLVLDREGRIVRFNRACERMTGYSFAEVENRYVWDLFILPEESDGVRGVFRNLRAGMFPNRHTNYWRIRDGSRRLISWSNTAVANNDGTVEYVVPTGLDITEQRRAEDALAAETERLAVTLRSIGDGVITTDTDGKVVLLNQVGEELTGWSREEAAGRPIEEVFHIIHEGTRKRLHTPVDEVIRTGKTAELANHTVLVSRNGREHLIADSAAPIRNAAGAILGAVLVFRDMTEKHMLEQEVLKSQRMESLGVLAGGIAHDYNNLLMAILGNVNLAATLLKQGDVARAHERLSDAEKASVRAKDLTRQLLTFSKGGAPVKKITSAADLVREAISLAVRGTPARSDVTIPSDLWPIEADEGQISQVLHNLLINAVQAIGTSGGTIFLNCRNVSAGEGGAKLPSPRPYVMISIRDTGCGIRPEDRARIFDPYFTTKKKGIGLGLATSYSIVKRHEGLVTVESEVGKGAEFCVYLPAYRGASERMAPVEERHVAGCGRVLVMDDEEIVRSATGAMLQNLGYTVETARDGAEAVQRYAAARSAGAAFDVVIMDATVPGGMGGRDAMRALLKIDPQARVVLTSGYTSDALLVEHREHGFADVIQKPYTAEELGGVIKRVLGSRVH